MGNTTTLNPPAPIEALLFDIPEFKAARSMRAMAKECCAELGIRLTTIDVWTNPDAVVTHEILIGPAIVLLEDGEEIGRLAGPRSARQIKRFFATAIDAPQPSSAAIVHAPSP